jgi:hypothetical protein
MEVRNISEYAALVAIDWADQQHDELMRFSGIAPIIERSGKQFRIRWRYFCPKFFRQTFHEFAAQSIQDSFWARAYYFSQRAKGKDHHAAVRALAFKWIRIIWKCWQTRTPYNEVIYLETLRKKGSSLLQVRRGLSTVSFCYSLKLLFS